MNFLLHQHRFGLDIIKSDPELKSLWEDITDTLTAISDARIISEYEQTLNAMSISAAINNLIDSY